MTLSLDEYRFKLINTILMANSQQEVKKFSDDAMKELVHRKIEGPRITQFIDRILSDMSEFTPMNKDSQQWSNIKMAIIHFNRLKLLIATIVK